VGSYGGGLWGSLSYSVENTLHHILFQVKNDFDLPRLGCAAHIDLSRLPVLDHALVHGLERRQMLLREGEPRFRRRQQQQAEG
jgi:hypothetical protein